MLQRIVIFALLCLVFAGNCRLWQVKKTCKCRFLDFSLYLYLRISLRFNLWLGSGCLLIIRAALNWFWFKLRLLHTLHILNFFFWLGSFTSEYAACHKVKCRIQETFRFLLVRLSSFLFLFFLLLLGVCWLSGLESEGTHAGFFVALQDDLGGGLIRSVIVVGYLKGLIGGSFGRCDLNWLGNLNGLCRLLGHHEDIRSCSNATFDIELCEDIKFWLRLCHLLARASIKE